MRGLSSGRFNYLCCSHVFPGNKLTQKDNADSGVQFITPAGPGQSLLLRTRTNFCENLIYPKCTCSNPPPQIP